MYYLTFISLWNNYSYLPYANGETEALRGLSNSACLTQWEAEPEFTPRESCLKACGLPSMENSIREVEESMEGKSPEWSPPRMAVQSEGDHMSQASRWELVNSKDSGSDGFLPSPCKAANVTNRTVWNVWISFLLEWQADIFKPVSMGIHFQWL